MCCSESEFLPKKRHQQHREGVFRSLHYLNVAKRFPFSSGSVAAIYSSHMLEHLLPGVARQCLGECFRVLEPGGVLRLGVPDLDQAVEAHNPADPEPFLKLLFESDQLRGKNRHWWHYNEALFRKTLGELGFSSVERTEYRSGRCPDVERIDMRPESLFIEATK